ncbi:MAG TPA: hypothetical protein VEI07_05860 [Planctomycetaceae bacterium]|nr:hypothetical protein [Planctomycetaceae bacterium]
MNRTLLVFISCLAFVVGCGSHVDMNKQLEKAHRTQFAPRPGQDKQTTPEAIAASLESDHERANYLRDLAHDEKFDPKQHAEMLKKYENAPDSELSEAAKVLLAKAQ